MDTLPWLKPSDFTLAIKNRGKAPHLWRWEIHVAGKKNPVLQSGFFGSMSEATREGKAALAVLKARQTA